MVNVNCVLLLAIESDNYYWNYSRLIKFCNFSYNIFYRQTQIIRIVIIFFGNYQKWLGTSDIISLILQEYHQYNLSVYILNNFWTPFMIKFMYKFTLHVSVNYFRQTSLFVKISEYEKLTTVNKVTIYPAVMTNFCHRNFRI